MWFPSLEHNPIQYTGDTLKCSICKKEMTYQDTNQWWITLLVGTDPLALLINSCSIACESQLPQPSNSGLLLYHKGGSKTKKDMIETYLIDNIE
jgi:hypothetical protein